MIRFCSLASSSSANAVFVDIDGTHLLLDAGLSYRALNAAMEHVGRYVMDIDAVFITHKHGDHVKAVPYIEKNFPGIKIFSEARGNVIHGEPVVVGGALITPFRLSHDEPCHGYAVVDQFGHKLALVTDTGTIPCESLSFLIGCSAIIIETNHDTEMLTGCSFYPDNLMMRIFSDEGHLRNEQARDILELVSWKGLEVVMCYHISENCNKRELAIFEAYAGVQKESPKCQVVCADKGKLTEFFTIM